MEGALYIQHTCTILKFVLEYFADSGLDYPITYEMGEEGGGRGEKGTGTFNDGL